MDGVVSGLAVGLNLFLKTGFHSRAIEIQFNRLDLTSAVFWEFPTYVGNSQKTADLVVKEMPWRQSNTFFHFYRIPS